MPARYVGALDQGTTSTRFLIFDREGRVVTADQRPHAQIYPRPGWVEHDATEIWARCGEVITGALAAASLQPRDLAAVGVTNQRETVVVWDAATGEPVANAIVWQDTRSREQCEFLAAASPLGIDRFRATTGLPVATYFSAPKVAWILEHLGLYPRAAGGGLLFGTIDSWLIWNLTGGARGGIHVTDVTNASRTLLLDLDTLAWDPGLLGLFGIPEAMLPAIASSSVVYAEGVGGLAGVPIAADLGDQQAALFGQTCFAPGEAKNTYGTGCFLLVHTGERRVASTCGLITTVAHRLGEQPACYALEGSVAMAGAVVQWLRDGLGLIGTSAGVEPLARSVPDNGGAYLVPAFAGLFAPHWRSDARGVIAGLTRSVTAGHLARATLEATAFQTQEVVAAMAADTGEALAELKVDGGMVGNELLMQFQADLLGVPVVRPAVAETTALGAAFAAGLAVGFWGSPDELRACWHEDRRWEPAMAEPERARLLREWQKAVARSLAWVD
ncbi:MAG TPA: glycerol kinase GlpK [Actinomycetota bacterium]|nr:glycerol kinase GlpK [Actinomycetota bacterium]